MKTLHVVAISALSTLLAVITILALLFNGGAAIAQNPEPVTPNAAAVQDPEALVPGDNAPAPDAALEEANAPAATTDYLHVSGSAFVPLWDTGTASYGGSGCKYMGGSNMYLNYGLDLPYKSTLTQLRFYFKDTSASDGTLWLAQYDDGLGYTYLVTMTTHGTGGWGTTTAALNYQIDYDNYSYTLLWSPANVAGSTMQFCGFRVGYTKPLFWGIAMPLVEKN